MGLLAAWVDVFANIAQIFLLVLGMFLILVVLLQRGRGGGLAGAFGGAGGQSAFGTKAGDVFTKITIGIAVLWVITNGVSGMLIRASQSAISESQLPGGDDEEDGPEVSGTGDQNPIPEADELNGTGTDGTGTTGGEGTPDADSTEGADANTPDTLETPESDADPAGTDTPETDEAATPETGDAATEDSDAEEATESDVPSTDTVEENAPSPDSPDEVEEGATDGGDDAAVPPN